MTRGEQESGPVGYGPRVRGVGALSGVSRPRRGFMVPNATAACASYALSLALAFLCGVHLYWAFGGTSAVLDERDLVGLADGRPSA